MARKSKASDKPLRSSVLLTPEDQRSPDESIVDTTARKLTRPEVQAASVIMQFEGENHDVNALIRELTIQAEAVRRGDMDRAETMLIAQAHALDEIFASLARRSHLNMGVYPDTAERYMRLALKAQSQCRATLESLSAIKNPPVVYAKQANIAHGPQQVNNGTEPVTRTGNTRLSSNELSGGLHELLPDTRASQVASRIDTPLEALGEVDRTED